MLKGFLLGIFIYSLIQTVFCIYKDNSGYFIIQGIDFVLAGPVAWLLFLFLWAFSPLYPYFKKCFKKGKEKQISEKEIAGTVKKVIRTYKKHNKTTDYFDFDAYSHRHLYDDWNNYIDGWEMLMVKDYRYERLNRKFERIMWNKKEAGIRELKKYSAPVSREEIDSLDMYSPPKDDQKIYKII